jgi:hypothetical protein
MAKKKRVDPSDFDDSCRRLMPGGVGPVFIELRRNAIVLQALRELLFELYGSVEVAQLLDYTSPYFFAAVRDAFLRELLTSLARFTDAAASGGGPSRENLSLPRLLRELEAAGAVDFANTIRPRVATITRTAGAVRALRNKVLAHSDLQTALGTSPQPLPTTTRRQAESLIDRITRLLNKVELRYRKSATMYGNSIASGATSSLLRALEQSRQADEELRRQ